MGVLPNLFVMEVVKDCLEIECDPNAKTFEVIRLENLNFDNIYLVVERLIGNLTSKVSKLGIFPFQILIKVFVKLQKCINFTINQVWLGPWSLLIKNGF